MRAADPAAVRRRRLTGVARVARFTGLVLLHLLVALAAATWLIHAVSPAEGAVARRRLEVTFRVTPMGASDVRVSAEGACGATCGVEVQWTASTRGRVIDRARGIVAFVEVERDVPMLVTAELRDRTGVIGRGGVRFVYDGQVRKVGG